MRIEVTAGLHMYRAKDTFELSIDEEMSESEINELIYEHLDKVVWWDYEIMEGKE